MLSGAEKLSPGSDARVLKGAMVKFPWSHGDDEKIHHDYQTYHDVLPVEIWECSEWKFTLTFFGIGFCIYHI